MPTKIDWYNKGRREAFEEILENIEDKKSKEIIEKLKEKKNEFIRRYI